MTETMEMNDIQQCNFITFLENVIFVRDFAVVVFQINKFLLRITYYVTNISQKQQIF